MIPLVFYFTFNLIFRFYRFKGNYPTYINVRGKRNLICKLVRENPLTGKASDLITIIDLITRNSIRNQNVQ